MPDYTKYQTVDAIPDPASLIETFRAIGYNVETAIADIIDNSIAANAKNIWISFDWKGSDTSICIKDDGLGMNNDALINAMRPGSINPTLTRHSNDLGRFGLGLKTASFSQCRKFTVLSKKEGQKTVYWSWDLDYIKQAGKWRLLKIEPEAICKKEIEKLSSGTFVIWEKIDRLVKNFDKNNEKEFDKFLQIMQNVKKHVGMVFHRFIESDQIHIYFQDREVEPWDPFLKKYSSTQGFPEECIDNNKVLIKGYVLPHKSKLSDDEYKQAEGIRGWNEQQGFYIYRNKRMLLSGDWLGLFRKEEHYKLTRIQIDIDNTLDEEWHIDIKKAIAKPPIMLRDRIRAYAEKVRKQAVDVHRHKGKTVKNYYGFQFVKLWLDHKRGDKWYFRINREHPVIEKLKNMAKKDPVKSIETLIRYIEETIPSKSIYIKEAEASDSQGNPFEGINHDDIRSVMKNIYDSLLTQGKTSDEAKAVILNLEPFNHYPQYIDTLD